LRPSWPSAILGVEAGRTPSGKDRLTDHRGRYKVHLTSGWRYFADYDKALDLAASKAKSGRVLVWDRAAAWGAWVDKDGRTHGLALAGG